MAKIITIEKIIMKKIMMNKEIMKKIIHKIILLKKVIIKEITQKKIILKKVIMKEITQKKIILKKVIVKEVIILNLPHHPVPKNKNKRLLKNQKECIRQIKKKTQKV